MYVIVGLGNPGEKYKNTRHNAGFMVLDRLAEKLDVPINKRGFRSVYGKATYNGEKLILIKPVTFMNLSGGSIVDALYYYKLDISKLIVAYDDTDLAVGRIRLRRGGSAGTHNGMKSIISSVDSDIIKRVRVGISKPPEKMDLADYVLQNFTEKELHIMNQSASVAAEAILSIIDDGIEDAMQKYNGFEAEE